MSARTTPHAENPVTLDAPDVVGATFAHQTNLHPPAPGPARVVVLALPRPFLCAHFEPERFEALRGAALTALAARAGGGDGPAPLIDLERLETPLPALLARLAAEGVERLVLFGAVERPAFAREIVARFDGGVEATPEDALLFSARLAPAPVVELGAGLYRVDAGCPVPAGAAAVLCRAVGGDVPPCLPAGVPSAPLALDPKAALGAGLGLLPPAALAGTPEGTTLRASWAVNWPHAVFRAAVLGLDAALEARLGVAPEPLRLPVPVRAVTGMDGSGKSTHVDHLARALGAAGARVAVVKLYRQGAFLALADELGARTRRGAPLGAFRLSRVVKLWDTLRVLDEVLEPAATTHDVLVGDRWAETHVAAAESQLGWDLRMHGALARIPAPSGCAWLLLPPQVALDRLAARGIPLTADEHAAGLAGYARVFDALARGAENLRLDARAPEPDNAARLRAFFELPEEPPPAGPGDAAPTPPPQAPPAKPSSGRAQVVLGRVPDAPALAMGALAWTRRAGPLTLDFRLEGLAARCLLDLRERRPTRACAPLWPAVLARLFPDLGPLAELDHLLAQEALVVGYVPPVPADFAALASPAGARRLAAAYGRALAELAIERGWAPLAP